MTVEQAKDMISFQIKMAINSGDEIEHLKKENEELKKKVFIQEEIIIGEQTENEQLKKQIEKMKSCKNCKHYGNYNDDIMCTLVGEKIHCKNKDKWELNLGGNL